MSSERYPRARLTVGALLVALAPLLAGCTPGVVPPSVCAVCDERMVDTAVQQGANVSITHSEVHLYLRADGSTRWEVHVTMTGEGVEAFQSNETLRRTIVERRLRENSGPTPTDPQNLTVRMDGRTLVVSFVDVGFAERRAGDVLLVDTFNHQTASTASPPFVLRADRMMLHPPEGWTVLNQVPGTETRTDALVWRDSIHERTYVVVGPNDGPTREAYGQAAVADEVAGWASGRVLAGSFFPIGITVIGLVIAFKRTDCQGVSTVADEDARKLVASLTVAILGVLAAGVGVALWHAPVSRVIGGVLSSLSGPDIGSSLPAIGLLVVLLVIPQVFGFFVAGLLAHQRPALRWPAVIVTVATVLLEVLWMVLVAPDIAALITVLVLLVTGIAAVIGIGVFDLGRRWVRSQGWVPEADPPSKTLEGDEHAGE